MEGLNVTYLWMGGVVAMMLIFGVAAIIGYLRQKPD